MKLRLVVICLALGAPLGPRSAAALPPGFVDETLIGNWETPTSIEFDALGRLWVAEKQGRLWIVENGVRHPSPFLDIIPEVHNAGDKGLLGFTLDPDFVNNGHVYLLYMVDPVYGQPDDHQSEPTFARVTRYTAVGDTADTASRLVLIGNTAADGIPSCHTSHTTGTVTFAADGTLLVGSGDGAHFDFTDSGQDSTAFDPGCEALFGPGQDIGALRAQSLDSFAGKILRIDPATGLGLPGNPFYDGDPASHASRIWVRGLRNPFRFTVRPGTPGVGVLFIGDVGWGLWEEVNVAYGGENFGWPCYEGNDPQPQYAADSLSAPACGALSPGSVKKPALAYHHWTPGALGFTGFSVTGGVFYNNPGFPPEYQGKYFFADFVLGWIRVATVNNWDLITSVEEFTDLTSWVIELEVDPGSGDLVYINILNKEVRRIRYAIDELSPRAVASASPVDGRPPLSVGFSTDGTTLPNDVPLAGVVWDFGDGSPPVSDPNPVHVYAAEGEFTARVVVANQDGYADTAFVSVQTLNAPPAVAIVAPADGQLFTGSEELEFGALAVDPEGGPLDYAWQVGLVHNSHVHPSWFESPDPSPQFTVVAHGDNGDRYHYRIVLTVTDEDGASTRDTVRVLPSDAAANHAPVASFSATTYQGPAPLLVGLDATQTLDPDTDLLGYGWTFGDGTTGTGKSTTHIFGSPGLYTVTLTAVDPARAAGSTTATVLVDLPEPDLRWQLDETSGTTATDVGLLGANGELTGSAAWGPGVLGGALDLAAPDDGVQTGDPILSGLPAFTLAAWIRPDSLDSAAGILGQHEAVEVGFAGGGDIRVWTAQGGAAQAPYPYPAGSWHHVAATGDGSRVTLYLDGVEAASTESATADYGSSTYWFGSGAGVQDTSGMAFFGAVDELRFYATALPPAAIAYLAAPPGANTAPAVDAGSDFAAVTGELSVLYGIVGDDGRPSPPASLTYAWTQVSGPGTAVLYDPFSLYTTAAFPEAGTYVFRLTADDGDLSGFDELEATVTGLPVDVPPDTHTPRPGLRQVVPNPATAHAMISFRLAAPEPRVLLTIHDIAGRRVAVLHEGPLGPGDHSVFWDRRDDRGVRVASGTYFVLLQTATTRYTTKITALR